MIDFVRFITSLCQASKFSNLMSFPLASTMIMLVFLSFLASLLAFFFLKDQIASFKLKQIEGSVACVFHYCVDEIESDYSINYGAIQARDSFRTQRPVNSLTCNMS